MYTERAKAVVLTASLCLLSLPDGTGEDAIFVGLAGDRGSSTDIVACVQEFAGSAITFRNKVSVNGALGKRGDGELRAR